MPIFYESIVCDIPNVVNTLIYTILKHFVGTPSNISTHDYLKRTNVLTKTKEDKTLEKFNKKKSKELTVNDLQHEINIVKQEISKLKHDFHLRTISRNQSFSRFFKVF